MGHKASDMTEQLTYLDEKCFQSLQNSLRCISRHKIEKEIPFIVNKKQRQKQSHIISLRLKAHLKLCS